MVFDIIKFVIVVQVLGYKVYMYFMNDMIVIVIIDGYFDGIYGVCIFNVGDIIFVQIDMDGILYLCMFSVIVGGLDVMVVVGLFMVVMVIIIIDVGEYMVQIILENVIQEMYLQLLIMQVIIFVLLIVIIQEDGMVFVKFSGMVFGWLQIGSKEVVLFFFVNVLIEVFQFLVFVFMDLDDFKDIWVCVLVSRDVDNDIFIFDCEVCFCVVGDF